MGIGASVFLIAVGAVLWLAVTWTVAGISINTVGIILVVCGVIGLLWSLFAATAAGRDREVVRERHTTV